MPPAESCVIIMVTPSSELSGRPTCISCSPNFNHGPRPNKRLDGHMDWYLICMQTVCFDESAALNSDESASYVLVQLEVYNEIGLYCASGR